MKAAAEEGHLHNDIAVGPRMHNPAVNGAYQPAGQPAGRSSVWQQHSGLWLGNASCANHLPCGGGVLLHSLPLFSSVFRVPHRSWLADPGAGQGRRAFDCLTPIQFLLITRPLVSFLRQIRELAKGNEYLMMAFPP